MPFTLVNNGIFCVGATSAVIDIGNDTTETDNSISSLADIVVVLLQGYKDTAADTDFTLDMENASNDADTATREFTVEGNADDTLSIFTFFRSDLSNLSSMSDITQFDVGIVGSYSEGVTGSFAAYQTDGIPQVIDSDGSNGSASASSNDITLTGLENGDKLVIAGGGGIGVTALDMTGEGQTELDIEDSGNPCNTRPVYGLAEKTADAASEVCTVDVTGGSNTYPVTIAIALRDPGLAFFPIPLLRSRDFVQLKM